MAGIVTAIEATGILASLTFMVYALVRYVRSMNKIRAALYQWPGLPEHWLYGNLKQNPMSNPSIRNTGSEAAMAFLIQMTTSFPRGYYWFVTRIGGRLVANHPDILRAVTKGRDSKPLMPVQPNYRFLFPWLGYGLLLSGGNTWFRNRRLLTQAFHFDILKPYMAVYNKATDVLLSKMGECASSGRSFEVTKNVSLCTLDILLQCAFSFETDCQITRETHPYVTAVNEISLGIRDRFFSPSLFLDFMFMISRKGKKFYKNCDFVHGVSEAIIQTRRAQIGVKSKPDSSNHKHLDFLDILLLARDENGVGLTDLEIRNEVDTFLFEGHDTTASSLTWMIYLMAKHPEHQRKVQAEIDQVMEGRDSDEILWEDLGKFTYLVQCLKESMRKYPPVPAVQRVLEQDTVVGGRVLPAGTAVDSNIFGLHHNPTVWPDAMKFIPDRFSPENIKKMDPFAFLPFSAGPRNCIGQNFAWNEEKVILARLLRGFHIDLDPSHEVVPLIQLVFKSKTDIKIKVTPRSY